jgi:hypothetical protein
LKLIGSKAEQEFREQLIKSHQSLFRDKERQRLLNLLKNNFPKMKTAYVIGWTPEQGEDIYRILIDKKSIAGIVIDRFDLKIEPIVEKISLSSYKQGLSKIGQIKLAVAIDLATKDLTEDNLKP